MKPIVAEVQLAGMLVPSKTAPFEYVVAKVGDITEVVLVVVKYFGGVEVSEISLYGSDVAEFASGLTTVFKRCCLSVPDQ